MNKNSILADSAVVRSPAARTLFLASALVTVAIVLWTQHIRVSGYIPRFTPIYYLLFANGDNIGALVLVFVLLGAVAAPAHLPIRTFVRWVGAHPGLIVVLSAFVMMCGTLLVYHDHRLSMDEYTAYFQSQVFAAGHLAGQVPPALLDWVIPPGFQDAFIDVSHATGRAASGYWPTFSLILAPFTWAGIPWACNPIISALTLLGMHRLALGLFDDIEAAGMALLLGAASPVIFANGISYYAMPAHLLASTVYAILLLRPTLKRAFFAGVVGSIALTLHNPVPHILFCLPWLVWLATRKGGMYLLGAACIGYLPLCALLGLGWYWYTGSIIHDGAAHLGAVIRMTNNHQDLSLIFHFPSANTLLIRLMDLAKLWVWAVPGLLVLTCAGAWRWRHNPTCLLLAASALATIVGYLFFPYDQGHGWGNRYFHAAWVALPLLATAALFRPVDEAGSPTALPKKVTWMFEDPYTRAYVTMCIILMLILGVGGRAWQIQDFIADDLAQLPHYHGTEHRVVIISDKSSLYGGDLVQNDPWLRGDVIRMYSAGATADAQMMHKHFPALHEVYTDQYGAVWSERRR